MGRRCRTLANVLARIPGIKQRKQACKDAYSNPATKPKNSLTDLGRFIGAALLSFAGVLFLLAGLIEGQALAFSWTAVFLGGAYWVYAKR